MLKLGFDSKGISANAAANFRVPQKQTFSLPDVYLQFQLFSIIYALHHALSTGEILPSPPPRTTEHCCPSLRDCRNLHYRCVGDWPVSAPPPTKDHHTSTDESIADTHPCPREELGPMDPCSSGTRTRPHGPCDQQDIINNIVERKTV